MRKKDSHRSDPNPALGPEPDYLTIGELAASLGWPKKVLVQLTTDRVIPYLKHGRQTIRYLKEKVAKALDRNFTVAPRRRRPRKPE